MVRLGTWRGQTSSASIFGLQDEPEKASIAYETDIASFADAACGAVFVDPRFERALLDNSPSDLAKFVTMIRKCAAEKNRASAKAVFEAAKTGGVELNSFVYDTLLDAKLSARTSRQPRTSWN